MCGGGGLDWSPETCSSNNGDDVHVAGFGATGPPGAAGPSASAAVALSASLAAAAACRLAVKQATAAAATTHGPSRPSTWQLHDGSCDTATVLLPPPPPTATTQCPSAAAKRRRTAHALPLQPALAAAAAGAPPYHGQDPLAAARALHPAGSAALEARPAAAAAAAAAEADPLVRELLATCLSRPTGGLHEVGGQGGGRLGGWGRSTSRRGPQTLGRDREEAIAQASRSHL